MRTATAVIFAVLIQFFLIQNASAHIGKGVAAKKRHMNAHAHAHAHHIPRMVPTPVRRSPSTSEPSNEPSDATNTNAQQECAPYDVPAVDKLAKQFPTIWGTANIVKGDATANAVWARIQASGIIPTNIQPKGTGGKGNFNGVKYDSSTDPDCWWTDTNCHTPKHKGIPEDIWECAEPDTWGLTFDDGPNCTHNAFYDFLQTNNQKATLFYIGSNVMDWPLEAERGIVDGHQVCVHTWSHQYMTQLTSEEVFAELYYTAKAIKEIAGITPRCWRPPYGDVDDRVRAIATGLGMSTNIWSADTNDWQIAPEGNQPKSKIDSNYASIIGGDYSEHGNIVLTHEIDAGTMNEMMQQYPNIKAKFKNIVPITACMNISNPYEEQSITYPTFAEYVAGTIMPVGIPNGSTIVPTTAVYSPVAYAAATTTNLIAGAAASATTTGTPANAASKSNSTSSTHSSGAVSFNLPQYTAILPALAFLIAVALV